MTDGRIGTNFSFRCSVHIYGHKRVRTEGLYLDGHKTSWGELATYQERNKKRSSHRSFGPLHRHFWKQTCGSNVAKMIRFVCLLLLAAKTSADCLADESLNSEFASFISAQSIPVEGSCCQADVCGLACPADLESPGIGMLWWYRDCLILLIHSLSN